MTPCGHFTLLLLYSVEHAGGQKDLGLVGQSLVTGLREELADYYRLLSLLEDQLKAKKSNSDDEGMAMTLHKLSVYTMDPLAKMKVNTRVGSRFMSSSQINTNPPFSINIHFAKS